MTLRPSAPTVPIVRMLGVLEVMVDGDRVDLPGARARAVLARLALSPGTTVSAQRLIDDVWGEEAPRNAVNALQVRVSVLRRTLTDGVRIDGRPPGYVLQLPVDEVDALRAQRLVAEGRSLAEVDAGAAAERLAEAIGLWGGTSFDGLGDAPFVVAARAHWDELYLGAQQELIRLQVAQGRGAATVADLERLCAQNPLHEPLHEQLVSVLAGLGRQADALAVLRRIRARLAEELGIDPGGPLVELEGMVLAQDPTLLGHSTSAPLPSRASATAPVGEAEPQRAEAPVHARRPEMLTRFLHRESDVVAVRTLQTDHRLVTVTGPGGVGKTRLALHLADLVETTAPLGQANADTVWFVPLDGVRDPGATAFAVAAALGVASSPDPVAAVVQRLRGAVGLVVLDNCEHLSDAPARLAMTVLSACPGVRILATSQRPLGVVGEAVWRLAPLGENEAVDLFLQRAREQRPGLLLDDQDLAAVQEVCRRLEGLPLALELAAARCHVLPVAELLTRLPDALALPRDERAGRAVRHQTLAATIAWSYDILFPDAQLALQALAAFPDGASLSSLEWVLEELGLPAEATLDVVMQLVDCCLVDSESAPTTRLRTADSVRSFARRRATETGNADRYQAAIAGWVVKLASDVAEGLRGSAQRHWVGVLSAERATVDVGLDWLTRNDPVQAATAAGELYWAWLITGDAMAGAERLARALEASGDALPAADRCLAQGRLALLLHRVPDIPRGLEAARTAVSLARDELGGEAVAVARAEAILGLVLVHNGRSEEGRRLIGAAQEVLRLAGQRWDAGMCLLRLGYAAQLLADVEEGERLARRALTELAPLGDLWVEHAAWRLLGVFQMMRGAWEEALASFEQVLQITRNLGFLADEARTLEHLGDVHLLRGDPGAATAPLRSALEAATRVGDGPFADQVRATLVAAHRAAGEVETAAELLGQARTRRRGSHPVDLPVELVVQSGATAASAQDWSKAVLQLTTARSLAQRAGDVDQEVLALDALARAWHGAGDVERSRAAGAEADALASQPRLNQRPLHRVDRPFVA